MTIERLRQIHQARPIRPFVIHLADGRHFRVNHPGFLAQSPSGRTAILYGSNDAFEVIDLLLVTTVEVPDGQLA